MTLQGLLRASGAPASTKDQDVRIRVTSEFQEMPGLTLTLPQAARLFGMDLVACERVLGGLVDGGLLRHDGRSFARADGGRPHA